MHAQCTKQNTRVIVIYTHEFLLYLRLSSCAFPCTDLSSEKTGLVEVMGEEGRLSVGESKGEGTVGTKWKMRNCDDQSSCTITKINNGNEINHLAQFLDNCDLL